MYVTHIHTYMYVVYASSVVLSNKSQQLWSFLTLHLHFLKIFLNGRWTNLFKCLHQSHKCNSRPQSLDHSLLLLLIKTYKIIMFLSTPLFPLIFLLKYQSNTSIFILFRWITSHVGTSLPLVLKIYIE